MGSVGAYASCKCLSFHEPVGVRDDGVGLVEVGEQIQLAGSAVTSVRPVFHRQKVVLDGSHNLLTKGAVKVLKGIECQGGRVMSVADGCCFRSVGACQDNMSRYWIGRGNDLCFRESYIYGGGEGEAKVYKSAAAEGCVDRLRVRVEELVRDVDRGVHRFAVDWWDHGVFKALGELIDGGGRHVGGGRTE